MNLGFLLQRGASWFIQTI